MYNAMTSTLAPSMNTLPPPRTYPRNEPRTNPTASAIRPATTPDEGLPSSVRASVGYCRAKRASLLLGASRKQTHFLLEREQLLVGVGLHLEALELLDERIARQLFVDLGRRDELALFVLDLLGHALERLERTLIGDRAHRLLNALVRLSTLLARDQNVLLALGLFDLVVERTQRVLELVGLFAVLDPRVVELHRVLDMLVVAQQRLFGEIVAAFLHRQHGPLLPVLGELLFLLGLGREALLVGDRGRH